MPSTWSSAVRWNVPVCAPRVAPLSSEMFCTPERSIDLSVSSEKKKNEYSFYMSLTGIIMGLLASVRIIFQVFSGIITLGEYTLLQSYVVKMQSSLDSLVNNILQLAERNLYLEN